MTEQPVAAADTGDRAGSGRPLGLVLALALVAGGSASSFVGLGSVVQIAFPALAVVIGAWLLMARRAEFYVEFVLWLWLLTPAVRRVVDLAVGWTPVSPVMTAAPAATLLCLLPGLLGRRRIDATMGGALVVSILAVCYGLAVGVVVLGLGSPLAAALSWLPPLALGLYVATAGPDNGAELRAVLRRTALLGSAVLGTYGIFQFINPPDWDTFWMANAPINSAGFPRPFEVRVFSTLNSPAPFAAVLGVLLILLTGIRARSRGIALLVGLTAFGLSLVRTAWLGYLVGILSLLLPGRGRLLRSTVVGLGIPLLLLLVYGGPIAGTITERFTSSTASGADDESLNDRIRLYTNLLPEVLRDPVGDGLGSTGVATKVGNDGDLAERGNFDSGALEILFVFGLPVGLALLAAVVLAARAAWRVASTRGDFEKAMAAALLALLVQLPLYNPLTTPSGIFFWLLVGYLARPAVLQEETGLADVGSAHTASTADSPHPAQAPSISSTSSR